MLIRDLREVFPTNRHVNEFLYCLYDLKPAIIDIINSDAKELLLQLCNKHSLHVAITEHGTFLTYTIAKNPAILQKISQYQISPNAYAYELGELLGYPTCCAKRFLTRNEDQLLQLKELTQESTDKNPKECNIFPALFDFHLLCHIPCSFYCESSKTYAKEYLELLKNIRPTYVQFLEQYLKSSVLFFEDGEIYLLSQTKKNKQHVQAHVLASTVKNKIAQVGFTQKENTKITMDDKQGYFIEFE